MKAIATDPDAGGSVTQVDFYADGEYLGYGIRTGNLFNFTWFSADLGTHILSAKATDNHGISTTSGNISVTVTDTPPPTITCLSSNTVAANASCQGAVPDVTHTVSVAAYCYVTNTVTVTQSPAAGTQVDLGTSTITVTVAD